jgi:hypothetical protein
VATATKTKKVLYTSTAHDLVLPRVKPDEQVLPNGKIHVRNSSDYEKNLVKFTGGFFEVNENNNRVLPTGPMGEDEDLVGFLERQPTFGNLFQRLDEPAPAPTVEELERIGELISAGDRAGLAEVYKAELDGDERPEILRMIEAVVKDEKS